jgi:predicted secreted protein
MNTSVPIMIDSTRPVAKILAIRLVRNPANFIIQLSG